jgi:hypothetical protein
MDPPIDAENGLFVPQGKGKGRSGALKRFLWLLACVLVIVAASMTIALVGRSIHYGPNAHGTHFTNTIAVLDSNIEWVDTIVVNNTENSDSSHMAPRDTSFLPMWGTNKDGSGPEFGPGPVHDSGDIHHNGEFSMESLFGPMAPINEVTVTETQTALVSPIMVTQQGFNFTLVGHHLSERLHSRSDSRLTQTKTINDTITAYSTILATEAIHVITSGDTSSSVSTAFVQTATQDVVTINVTSTYSTQTTKILGASTMETR